MTKITDLRVFDLRFPTSQSLDGSDAMNPDPDYSAAYVILDTDDEALKGHGLTFTIDAATTFAVRRFSPCVIWSWVPRWMISSRPRQVLALPDR